MVARETEDMDDVERDIVAQTFDVLRSLGHSESDARLLLDETLKAEKKHKDVESLIQAVYAQSR